MNPKLSGAMPAIWLIAVAGILAMSVPGAAAAQDTARTHIVSAGETLYSISRRHGVSVEQLRAWNNLGDQPLGIGVELIVVGPASGSTSPGGAPVQNPSPASSPGSGAPYAAAEGQIRSIPSSTQSTYVVRRGDTLFGIARQFDVSVEQLRDRNRLKSDELTVGQVLAIRTVPSTPSLAPAPASAQAATPSAPQGRFGLHVLREGESAMEVARRFQIDSTEFAALNPGIDPSSLRAGQSVTVLLPQSRLFPNPYRRITEPLDGSAVWVTSYPETHRASPTASGELHDPDAFTAAHASLPLGTMVMLEHPENGLSILVRINDRSTGGGLRVSPAVIRFLNLQPDTSPDAPAGGQTRYRAVMGRVDLTGR